MSTSCRSRTMTLTHSLVSDTDTAMETTSAVQEGEPYTTTPEREEGRSISKGNGTRARTLVLCFDGTGDQFDEDNSNIVEFFSLLKKDDPTKQAVYYQAGIGTYTAPHFASRLTAKISKVMDEAIAWNLHSHVMHGYEFLMQNYTHGDKICIFGFSRGAYTARSLAGMVHKIGIIPAWNFQQVPFAWKMYKREDTVGWQQSKKFKETFSAHAKIEFLGVWDTVDSVGIIPRRLPFTRSNTNVKTFRHAMALDEHRVKFKFRPWEDTPPDERAFRMREKERHRRESEYDADDHKAKEEKAKEEKAKEEKAKEDHSNEKAKTDVKEVWFAGAHCDVGGGSVPNETKPSLARISLRWMVRECHKTETGILFDCKKLEALGLDPVVLSKETSGSSSSPDQTAASTESTPIIPSEVHISTANESNATTVKEEKDTDLEDATSKIFDQLRRNRVWWILEFIPLMTIHRKEEQRRVWKRLGCNLGGGRVISKPKNEDTVKIHKSVYTRIMHEGYQPKARLVRNEKRASERSWPTGKENDTWHKAWRERYKVEWVD